MWNLARQKIDNNDPFPSNLTIKHAYIFFYPEEQQNNNTCTLVQAIPMHEKSRKESYG